MTVDRVKELEKLLVQHRAAYDAGKPTLTDAQFDALENELRALAPASQALKHLGAAGKLKHAYPVLSLDKCYSDDDLIRWAGGTGAEHFVVQPKYDGVSMIATYMSGFLAHVALRGDGLHGDNVTVAARSLLPARVMRWSGHVVVRGEVVMRRSTFKARYGDRFANPRNLVAGAVRKGEKAVLADLQFFAHEVTSVSNGALRTIVNVGRLHMSSLRGILTREATVLDLIDVKRGLAEDLDEDKNGPESDGIVVKVVDDDVRRSLGATDHHPRWAIAFKFQGESGETTLNHVQWQVSRRGVITPVALVDPVELNGVTVTRSTMHNLDQLKALDLKLGDRVLMTRRGGVIPHIEKRVAPAANPIAIAVPKACPSCASKTVRRGGFLLCSKARTCRDAAIARLVHWAAVIGVEGFGPERAAIAYDEGGVRTVFDLYRFDWYKLMGKAAARSLAVQFNARKTLAFDKFLAGLGFEGVGRSIAKKLLDEYKTIDSFCSTSEAVLCSIPGIGAGRAASILADVAENSDLIEALLTRLTIEGAATKRGAFVGMSIVFTGALTNMSRAEARGFVEQNGGEAPDGVRASITHLVVGDDADPNQKFKRNKAQEYIAKGYPIKIISEDEFTLMVAEAAQIEE